jgi:hypothetical protein
MKKIMKEKITKEKIPTNKVRMYTVFEGQSDE